MLEKKNLSINFWLNYILIKSVHRTLKKHLKSPWLLGSVSDNSLLTKHTVCKKVYKTVKVQNITLTNNDLMNTNW
jgi:hypothetical protein